MRQREGQRETQRYIERCRHTYIHRVRDTYIQKARLRQTGRPDRQTHRQTYIQIDKRQREA